ncbi:MAG: hypothetical protein ACOC47_05520 [Alkalispirochaetaceae bacterium]
MNRRSLSALSLPLLFMLVPLTAVGAFEWGGSVTNTSQYETQEDSSEEDEFFQSNTLAFFLETPLGESSEFAADAAYTYSTDRAFLLDLRQAHLTRQVQPESGPTLFATRVGRFRSSDPTGEVLSHTMDGLRLTITYPELDLELTAGYTGLLLQPTARVSLSRLDQEEDEADELLAPSRLIGQIRARMPDLFLGQSLEVALLFQEDLRDPNSEDLIEPGADTADPTRGGLVDTQYALLAVNGPILGNLFYNLYGVANTGRTLSFVEDESSATGQLYEYKPFLAGLFGLRFDYFMPEILSSRASLFGRLGTGDEDYGSYTEGNSEGTANLFTPITPRATGEVLGIEAGNSAHIGVSYSMRPFTDSAGDWLKRLQGEVTAYSYFRTIGEGVTSVGAIDSATEEPYLGSEINLAVRARPYSDFGIGVTTGVLFANEAALVDDARETDFLVRLDASLSF